MQHCTKNHRQKSQIYYRGPPPSLETSPREWFSYADINRTGYICQQNIFNTVCAHLRPTHQHQHRFLLTKINGTIKSCNFYSNQKINVGGFLYCRMDKLIIQVEQEYEKAFRPNHFRRTKGGHHGIFSNPSKVVMERNPHGSENFVAPRIA